MYFFFEIVVLVSEDRSVKICDVEIAKGHRRFRCDRPNECSHCSKLLKLDRSVPSGSFSDAMIAGRQSEIFPSSFSLTKHFTSLAPERLSSKSTMQFLSRITFFISRIEPSDSANNYRVEGQPGNGKFNHAATS